jgi:hypothetical protein
VKKRRRRASDPDIIITDSTVSVPRLPDESREQYLARLVDAAPPLNENQKNTVRRAIRELRNVLRLQWMGPERRQGERRLWTDRRKHLRRITGPDRRTGDGDRRKDDRREET